MKSDMAGAAAVLSTMKVVGMLDIPLHVVAIAPCTENVPGGGSYHPADVLTASNGKTIEIISTDAEGRLILADALVYAGQFKPKAVVDLATLTGACVIALGEWVSAGLFSSDDTLRDKLVASGTRMHERLWPMPLYDDYHKKIVSIVADMANTRRALRRRGFLGHFLERVHRLSLGAPGYRRDGADTKKERDTLYPVGRHRLWRAAAGGFPAQLVGASSR